LRTEILDSTPKSEAIPPKEDKVLENEQVKSKEQQTSKNSGMVEIHFLIDLIVYSEPSIPVPPPPITTSSSSENDSNPGNLEIYKSGPKFTSYKPVRTINGYNCFTAISSKDMFIGPGVVIQLSNDNTEWGVVKLFQRGTKTIQCLLVELNSKLPRTLKASCLHIAGKIRRMTQDENNLAQIACSKWEAEAGSTPTWVN
jgi:hypothetical protein